MSALLVKRANQQGTQWKYDAVAEVAADIGYGNAPIPSTVEGLRRDNKGAVYTPALQFTHAVYLHSNLGYPIKKAVALATKYVNSKFNRLEPLYAGSIADQCYAINTMESVDKQNFKDTEYDRALEALAKAEARVAELERTRSKVKVA